MYGFPMGNDGLGLKRKMFMSVKKQYMKKKPLCKVTFRLNKKQARHARTVHVVGDFNGWDTGATPMVKLKRGAFSVIVDLEKGREYQFRYLLNGTDWVNDSGADHYVTTPYGDENNCVIVV